MRNSDPKRDSTGKVAVPVKRVDGRWEFLYGGEVPAAQGTVGELTLSASQIVDDRFRQRVRQELTLKILDEGTPLLVALSDRSTTDRVAGGVKAPDGLKAPSGTTRFERIHLGPLRQQMESGERREQIDLAQQGGLFLKLTGLERCELYSSAVLMPERFKEPVATSLNHAFTLLSQAYETHRISNTGNIYTRMFYEDRLKHWHPLDELRTYVQQAAATCKSLDELWADLGAKLGVRPLPIPGRPRRRK